MTLSTIDALKAEITHAQQLHVATCKTDFRVNLQTVFAARLSLEDAIRLGDKVTVAYLAVRDEFGEAVDADQVWSKLKHSDKELFAQAIIPATPRRDFGFNNLSYEMWNWDRHLDSPDSKNITLLNPAQKVEWEQRLKKRNAFFEAAKEVSQKIHKICCSTMRWGFGGALASFFVAPNNETGTALMAVPAVVGIAVLCIDVVNGVSAVAIDCLNWKSPKEAFLIAGDNDRMNACTSVLADFIEKPKNLAFRAWCASQHLRFG